MGRFIFLVSKNGVTCSRLYPYARMMGPPATSALEKTVPKSLSRVVPPCGGGGGGGRSLDASPGSQ